jgi:hypothetical protein
VEAAGFVLNAECTMLANKDHPHQIKVFDPSIRGETDRFAYRHRTLRHLSPSIALKRTFLAVDLTVSSLYA